MPFPILLPTNARSLSFIPKNISYNSTYDITWSFSWATSSTASVFTNTNQYGICTFLTLLTATEANVLSGHYLNTKITTSSSISAKVLSGITTIVKRPYNIISIAFDSTGFFALSTELRSGIPLSAIQLNQLIVRDIDNNIIHTSSLSSTNFTFSGSNFIRCNYSNSSQLLSIDHRKDDIINYVNIASIPLPYSLLPNGITNNMQVGFTFCSPVSTSNTAIAPALKLTNFHVDGIIS